MTENENTDISSLSTIHVTKKDSKKECEKISEVKEPSSIIKAISEALRDTCEQSQLNKNEKLLMIKPFVTKKKLNISIYDYLNHLYKYSQVSEDIFIVMLIYIDRLKTNRKIYLNYFNIYKLILAAFVLAIKFNYDEYFTLDIYSEIGGVSQKEVSKQSDKRKKVQEFIDCVEIQSYEEGLALYPYRQFLSIARSFILQYDALAGDNYSNYEALYQSFLTLNRTVELIRDQYAGIKQKAIDDAKRLTPFVNEEHIRKRVERQIKQFETCVVPAIQSFNHYASFALGTNDFNPTDLKHPLED